MFFRRRQSAVTFKQVGDLRRRPEVNRAFDSGEQEDGGPEDWDSPEEEEGEGEQDANSFRMKVMETKL